MSEDKFLLIKTTKSGFWHDMHHVLGQLLEAELAHRIPIVYWDKSSMYSTSEGINAFEKFFLPVSRYGILDLMHEEFTFYPQIWNYRNLLSDGLPEAEIENRDPGGEADSSANVLIHNTYVSMNEIRRRMDKGNPLTGLSDRDIYSRMLKKYIKLRVEITDEIDSFYNTNMAGRPNVAVHIRGSDKILEVRHLHALNESYPAEIDRYLAENPSAHVFLMTDCSDILHEYRKLYGSILIATDCKRVLKHGSGVHFQVYTDNRNKGIEIIKDTWLAAKCDYFIGNGHSNVSRAVSELKDWRENDIRLLY